MFRIMVVILLHLLANSDEISHALDVVGVVPVDLLVQLQGRRVSIHASVAGSNHEPPLDLGRLDLRCSAKERDGRLIHLLLDIVDAEPCDNIHVNWPISVGFQVVMERLRLVTLLLEQICESRQDTWVCWPPLRRSHKQREPFVSLFVVAELLIDVPELPHNLAIYMRNGMELVESEKSLLIFTDVHVHEPQVVNGLQTVGTDADGLEVNFLGALEFVIHEHAITLVDERPRIVAVGLDGHVGVLLGLGVLSLKKVQERQVCRRASHQGWLLSLEFFQDIDRLVELFPTEEI
mmetsp:Transcript_93982/g.270784  ORF Transcript_93982/g.270784 Transcript_93982/m.270784 type:complete len:292 (-) Transcript_93982:1344-2219(-)